MLPAPDAAPSPDPSKCTDARHLIVKVALNRPLHTLYDYVLREPPPGVLAGRRVRVSFGRSEEIGVIAGTAAAAEAAAGAALKEACLIDERPLLGGDLLATLDFAARYYHYPLGQCLHAALPRMLRDGGRAGYREIEALELTEAGRAGCELSHEWQRRIAAALRRGPVRRRELRERGAPASAERALVRRGLARIITLTPGTQPYVPDPGALIRTPGPELNAAQAAAVERIAGHEGFGVFVLDGVTGSGKTEVYLSAIARTLRQGRRALVLVPEIALTPQTLERFYGRFGVPIACLHSALSDRERCDAFLDMLFERAWILIGTRSALLTPITNLGLVIMDEEHDASFKQGEGLRYHTRSLAIYRARLQQALVVLGSATPSLESLANCASGRFMPLSLPERAGGASLPDLELIDLRQQPLSEGLRSGICPELEERIGLETARGRQVLLFLNRRGYARSLICHDCAHAFMCPQCDSAMTVHHHEQGLLCHICGSRRPLPSSCPACGSSLLLENGCGTEQVEAFLRLRYPDIGVARVDRDTIRSRGDLERSLRLIGSGEARIVVGTQMLAKGHDFPQVSLVGILDIDASLYCDDFRALEGAAQLITQVAGRAGRSRSRGTVVIQSHACGHPLLRDLAVSRLSYAQVASGLLEARQRAQLPPYAHLAFALASARVREQAFDLLQGVHDFIMARGCGEGLFISPVISDRIEKRHGRHHFHILIRSPERRAFHELLDELTLRLPAPLRPHGDCRFGVDVDPLVMY